MRGQEAIARRGSRWLEAELVDGAIVLRPAAMPAPEPKSAAAAGPEQATPALQLEAEDEPAPLVEAAARSELRRKQPPAPEPHQLWAPVRDPRPERRGPDSHGEREKRPFRQIEVRKLGPGRGHDRAGRG